MRERVFTIERFCKMCAKQFTIGGSRQVYCSTSCRYHAIKRVKCWDGMTTKCPRCKKEFEAIRYNQRFCSGKCFRETLNIIDCQDCGNKLEPYQRRNVCYRCFYESNHKAPRHTEGLEVIEKLLLMYARAKFGEGWPRSSDKRRVGPGHGRTSKLLGAVAWSALTKEGT